MSRKQESGKCIWLITYAACSPNITHTILRNVGIDCDECHTTTWRESKYTLIRLNRSKRTRQSIINDAMLHMDAAHGIRGSSITGYDTLTSNTKEENVKEHPGFMRMVQLLNQRSVELESWINEGDVHTNRKGLLWKHIQDTDPADMTQAQLVHRVRTLAPLASENTRLRSENDNLTVIIGIRNSELADAQARINYLTTRNSTLFNELLDKTEECSTFRQRLKANKIDHTWSKRRRIGVTSLPPSDMSSHRTSGPTHTTTALGYV